MTSVARRRRIVLFITTLGLLPAPITGWAQTGAATRALEEVVVTARKREERLQETPISVSAFNAAELEFRQIKAADDLEQITPNLSFEDGAGSRDVANVYIRGIGQGEFAPVSDPGVGIYIDGVYLGRTVGSILDFADVERVEVLRGPQGTLFGRNTIGGAILVHTRKPDEEFHGNIEIEAGDDDLLYVTTHFNLPISQTLKSNFALTRRLRDGYVKRLSDGQDLGDEDMWGAYFGLLWEPLADFNVHITGDYTHKDENGAPVVSGGINDLQTFAAVANLVNPNCPVASLAPPARETFGNPNCANETANIGKFVNGGTFPVFHDFRGFGLSATLTWDATDWLTVKSITGYRYFNRENGRDADNSPHDVFATEDIMKHKQWTEEVQLLGRAFDARLDWVLGGYYFWEEANNLNPAFTPLGDLIAGGIATNEAWALFAQATYDITAKLSFTFGMRYSDDQREFFPNQPVTAAGFLCPGFAVPGGCLPVGSTFVPKQTFATDFDDFSTHQSVEYRWTEDLMTYFSRSEGFKTGGFDSRFVTVATEPSSFGPEEAETYEIGFKSEWLNRTLRLNFAWFHTDYEGIHIVTREAINPRTLNAGDAEIEGFELEAIWAPTDPLRLSLSIGHLDAEYTRLDQAAINAGITEDTELQETPEWTTSVGASYTFALPWGSLTPRLDWSYNSGEQNDAENFPLLEQGSYHMVNAALRFVTHDERWEITLAGRNLTDTTYLVAGSSAFNRGSSFLEERYNRPRNWSLAVQYNFL